MAAKRTLEAKLDRLRALEDEPVGDGLRAEVKKLLGSASGIVAGKAAKLAGAKRLVELVPDLVGVFERFLEDPVKTDPGCQGKCGAVEALTALGYEGTDVYVTGIRHCQPEPAWGKPVDTADKLRGLCAYALYAAGHPDLYYYLVDLLSDPEPVARTAAAQVLGNLASETAELLLRMKVRAGDPEPPVVGECLGALMRIAPQRSLPFVAGFLHGPDDLATEAAFALGESRLPAACARLIAARSARMGDARDGLLLPIALTRQEEALDYLLRVVAEEHPNSAEAALRTLPVLAADPLRVGRVAEAVRGRNDRTLDAAFREEFPAADS